MRGSALKANARFTLAILAAIRATLIAALVVTLTGCGDERKSPTAPDTPAAAMSIDNIIATATKNLAVLGPFTYRVSLRLRETTGVGATISQVTATLTDNSGAATATQIAPAEAFGTTSIQANGTLTSTGIVVMGSLATASDITVRVAFLDDHGKTGSAQASTGVRAEFTGEWSGSTTITQPPGDWSVITMLLAQNGDALTGELITRDGRHFPVTGCVSCEWVPILSFGGLPTGSSGCGIAFIIPGFEFSSSRTQKMAARLTGRCPGTAAGTADLQGGS